MLLEDLRLIHEDNERLEQAIAERLLEDPVHQRTRLARDHQIAGLLERLRSQSVRGKEIWEDTDGERLREIQSLTTGDPFQEFQRRLDDVRAFHKRYPGQEVENLERAYKRRAVGEDAPVAVDVDTMFSGEESFGRHFDLLALHEQYNNLPGLRKRATYMQYLDSFNTFESYPRPEKMKEQYFTYVTGLSDYLEGFIRRVKPLENLEKLLQQFDQEFEAAWEKDEVPGWTKESTSLAKTNGTTTQGTGEGVWCQDCEKEFKTDSVYRAHLSGKKHLRAAELRKSRQDEPATNGTHKSGLPDIQRLKEKAIAEKEFRIKKITAALPERQQDTKVNVDRKYNLTDKERAEEIELMYRDDAPPPGENEGEDSEDEDARKSNPLKLPIAWDGKPIPFWLYKLQGLGVEHPCEICGNYVYMGRKAFEKHFSEARHMYGLQCLGITSTGLFREITGIEEANALWEKIQKDRKAENAQGENVVQMEDSEGNVMPEKVYHDLLKAGLL